MNFIHEPKKTVNLYENGFNLLCIRHTQCIHNKKKPHLIPDYRLADQRRAMTIENIWLLKNCNEKTKLTNERTNEWQTATTTNVSNEQAIWALAPLQRHIHRDTNTSSVRSLRQGEWRTWIAAYKHNFLTLSNIQSMYIYNKNHTVFVVFHFLRSDGSNILIRPWCAWCGVRFSVHILWNVRCCYCYTSRWLLLRESTWSLTHDCVCILI